MYLDWCGYRGGRRTQQWDVGWRYGGRSPKFPLVVWDGVVKGYELNTRETDETEHKPSKTR